MSQDKQEFLFQFCNFVVRFSVYDCFAFSFDFEKAQTTQNISSEKNFTNEKSTVRLTFNPRLTLTGFRTA